MSLFDFWIEGAWFSKSPVWIDPNPPVPRGISNGSEYARTKVDHNKDDEKTIMEFLVFFSNEYM